MFKTASQFCSLQLKEAKWQVIRISTSWFELDLVMQAQRKR
jgi:hypothetical protein